MKLPRYRLRTLFLLLALVSIPMGWVAYQLNWIRQRHKFVDAHFGEKCIFFNWPGHGTKPPWPLELFGERGMTTVSTVEELKDEIKRLYPEAEIFIFDLN